MAYANHPLQKRMDLLAVAAVKHIGVARKVEDGFLPAWHARETAWACYRLTGATGKREHWLSVYRKWRKVAEGNR